MTSYNQLPKRIAVFLICCFIPQWITGSGMVAEFLKIAILLIFVWKVFSSGYVRYLNPFVMVYSVLYAINILIASTVYGGSVISVTQSIFITTVTLIIFYQTPKNSFEKISENDILQFYKVYVNFMVIACIYNMLINFRTLLNITSLSLYSEIQAKSFFDNKNTFGVFLIFGVLASAVLKIRTTKKRWVIITFLFIINELMALCRTAIVISLMIVFISVVTDENNRLKNILVVFGLSLIVFGAVSQIESFGNFVFNTIGNTESIDDRNHLITALLPLMKGNALATGYGPVRAVELATQYAGMRYYHNTYLQVFLEGGIPKLLFFVVAIFTSIRYSIKIVKYDRSASNICIMSLIVYLVYAYVEAVSLFESPVVSMTATAFVITMPILWHKCFSDKFRENGE